MTDQDTNRITALRAKCRRLESMVYQRDLALAAKYRYVVTTQIVQEAFRRAAQGQRNEVTPERIAMSLEDVLNHKTDENLSWLKKEMDVAVCSACDGSGCQACDLTGIPGTPKFQGSGKRVIRSTRGL